MTKPMDREASRKCGWCSRLLPPPASTGRPRKYCRDVCRQRDFEARQRALEVGLTEAELVVTRRDLEELHDQLYVLEAAIEDVERDLAGSPSNQDYIDAVAWLLQAARPLAAFPYKRVIL
ncbi:MAG TPA: hypothetical protein VM143_07540 [Acidimicrobiales bacterium]|nr:hypothetical protein [Acidimicrobiales bacterium]